MTHTTLAVVFRWDKAREQVRQQIWLARVPVIAAQLAAMRGRA